MGNVLATCLQSIFFTFTFFYDIVTLPLYFLVQQPWKTIEKSNRQKMAIISKDGKQITYKSLRPVSRQHTLIVREKIDTLDKVFLYAARQFGKRNCMGTRKILEERDEAQVDGTIMKKCRMGDYSWRTFVDAELEASRFGRGIRELGVKPRDKVAILAETRAEWMLSAQGLFKHACGVCTIYATLGEDGIIFALNQLEVSFLITSHDLMPKLKNILDKIPNIKTIIYFEDQLKPTDTSGLEKLQVIPYKKVVEMGIGSKIENTPARKEDLAILMYTSGSTGVPKGVQLTHDNIVVTMRGFLDIVEFKPTDMFLGFLPLAHVYELLAESTAMLVGVPTGYSTPLTLIDTSLKIMKGSVGDATVLRPTLMSAVPLLLDRIVKGIRNKVADGPMIKKVLFNFALQYKIKWTKKGYRTPIVDAIVFKKVSAIIGGRMRMMVSGGAPLSSEVHEIIRNCLCVGMIQGFGCTETSASGCVMDLDDITTGRSGAPPSPNFIKLVNWEEGNYFVNNRPYPQGEIYIGGGCVALGYFKMPVETEASFYEEDGVRWFRTGDIAEVHDDGTIKIIDRKKDLIKLQHGEYISLGKVEAELKTCQIIENICVYADSTKTYCVALVQPLEKGLTDFAAGLGIKGSFKELCDNPALERAASKLIADHGKRQKLNKFEIPTKYRLCSDLWTPDSGLVTAAFKIKRKELLEKYKDDIKRLYA